MTTLDIAELAIDVRAVTTPGRLDALERVVAGAVSTHVAGALAGFEQAGAGYPDDAEVFIERLDFDCTISQAGDGAELARSLAAHILEEIARAARTGACLVFRDRAEYVAALILALADGQAGRRWWFDAFAGLALVPGSNAVRTVVLDEGEAGFAALARLTARDLQRVARFLAREDAARIVERIALRDCEVAPPVSTLWEHAAELRTRDEDPNAWLLALVAAERAAAGSAGAPAIAALHALASLHRAVRAAPAQVAAAIAQEAGTALLAALATCGVDFGGLQGLDADALDDVRASVLEACERVAARDEAHASIVHHTAHGGALLLRVVLERTDWRAPWPKSGDDDVLAWLIVTRAMGSVATLRGDAALRLLMPESSAATADALANDPEMEDTIAAAASALMRALACRLPGCADASDGWLRANVLAFPARIAAKGEAIEAVLGRPPLDALLVLGGWKRAQCVLADGRRLALRGDAS